MIQNQNRSTRRILSFPAVHPCENIDPKPLIASIKDLALEICQFKSKSFCTNARNARETFRQVRNILTFIEEFPVEFDLGIHESAVLSLSELYFTLQKLRYLLEDCAREDARLFMIMKSDRVANQFRVFFRAIAAALDVLPLGLIDVSSEVKELIELVINQARKSRFEVDPDDKRVMGDIFLILGQFENGFVPDGSDLKRVLDYIGVRKWSDCNKEVKLVDSEIGYECSNEEKKGILSSLLGFLIYSRCVLFDSIDSKITQQQQFDSKCSSDLLNCINTDDFRCPISLEIMKDPVSIQTGHTYDRSSISKWFKSGNSSCPVTGKRLGSTSLVSNLVVKGLIQQFCIENGIPTGETNRKNRDITMTILAGSLAAEGAMKMVADFLADKLENGDLGARNKAAYEVRLLSKASIFNRSCLVESGVIPYLLKLLVSRDSLSQENAIAALLNLSKHSISKGVIVENRGLELIVDVLNNGLALEARQHSAATLFYLASVEEYRKLIGESTEAIPGLVQLVREGNDRARKNGLAAIYGLLIHFGNHQRVLASGVVPLLVNLLISCEKEELVTDSLAVLVSLAEKSDGAKVILCSGALAQVIGILDSSTSRAGNEQCVCLLLALCINGGSDVVEHLVKSPSLMGSLYSLLSEGTSRASKKASALIRILQEYYERSSSSSKTPILPRGRFIHALFS
ncbi:U-box domain-containing protein 19-like [Mercurialis annua]|uniref:U-box domain-containing protein 19-like n=1 Tax=Mercurialis annua TaxID=3986 RepID=UPI00215E538A|nr:U-box domain-containing protein 19-like [Mercurialis annua]